jgi:ABC-type Fe3+/spermidine/putrescine transport system ATPase subunit
VASFVGSVNVIDAELDKNRIYIKGASGGTIHHIPRKPDMDIVPQGDIVLLVRPEEINLHRKKKGDDAVPGTISAIRYRGGFYEIEAAAGINRIKSMLDKDVFLDRLPRIGEKIYLNFKQYKVFDAPEGSNKIHAMLKQYGYIE